MNKYMRKVLNILILIFPLLLIAIEEDLKKCSKEQDKVKRLNCYDILVASLQDEKEDEKHVDADKTMDIKEPSAIQLVIEETQKEVIQKQKELISSLKRELKEVKAKKQVVNKEEKEESFFASIVNAEYRNYRYFFSLDNGQKWSTSDTGKRAKLKTGQKVEIIPGAFGASYLKNNKGKFRLRRVR